MSKTVSATDARINFGEVLRKVAEESETYIVERSGRPTAVLLSVDEYDRLVRSTPQSDWWEQLREVQAEVQRELAGREPLDVNELIEEGRKEQDDALLEHLLRCEPGRSPGDTE